MWDSVWSGLTEHAVPLGALAAVLAISASVFSPFRAVARLWRKPERSEIVNLPPAPKGQLTVADFLRIRREMRADLLAELATADPAEAVILRRRVEELERQIADPDPALAAAEAEVAHLKTLLEREANQIGADRLRAAEEAMDRLDFSLADALFAEVEERQKLEIQSAARAAYGRGEIAEAELRWSDAATHYARAAQLDPSLEALHNATHFTQLAGDYSRAERLAQDYVTLARAGDDPAILSRALDRYATVLDRLGRYTEAEEIFTQALEIGRASIGEGHPDYATQLNNLAGVVRAQGRYAEAEGLYRQALEIGRATIGEGHPDYATRLNNLAGVVEDQGRYAEAEELYRQALEIDRATIGAGHPDYAIDLNNLAGVLVKLGRPDEARVHYEQALAIFRASLPPDHPHIQKVQAHLSKLP
ncbi:MAG: tetratricopeptide repeat protein [Paracoccaceae bacterium]|nr:tetratricopeptide repeat protein [Paracoccaceae bacterium]